MLRSLPVACLLLTACGSEPADPPADPDPTAEASAAADQPKPFSPPANARVIELGEPRLVPEGLQGKAHAPEKPDPRVTCRSNRETMARRFGPEQLEDREVHVGEGIMQSGTVVAEGTLMAQEVIWADSERSRIERIRVLGEGIRDPSGLGLGSTLAEMEKALGPFELSGFGWDYGGTVSLKGTKLEKLDGRVVFRLEPRDSGAEGVQEAMNTVSGDVLFASGAAEVEALDLVVGEFMMVCPEKPPKR